MRVPSAEHAPRGQGRPFLGDAQVEPDDFVRDALVGGEELDPVEVCYPESVSDPPHAESRKLDVTRPRPARPIRRSGLPSREKTVTAGTMACATYRALSGPIARSRTPATRSVLSTEPIRRTSSSRHGVGHTVCARTNPGAQSNKAIREVSRRTRASNGA